MPSSSNAADAAATQYRALAEAAGVVALPHRTVVAATGDDCVEFLQGMLTNDVAKLVSGEACPALALTIQGRVLADVDVLRLETGIWLLVDGTAATAMVEAFERLVIADDVSLRRDDAQATLAVVGPTTRRILAEVPAPEPWQHVSATIDGVSVRLLGGAPLGDDDVTLLVPREAVDRVQAALARMGAVPCDVAAFETRRIVRGVPRIGIDMGTDTLAVEMPVEMRISDRKGCYLGQEVVARATSRGHVNRRLRGIRFEEDAPAVDAALFVGEKEVGRVTSVASLPTGDVVGLALVRREHWDDGTRLAVGAADGPRAVVAECPLA